MTIDIKTLGQLIDELAVTNIRAWFEQERLMNITGYSVEERVQAAENAQRLNAKRNALIQAIDKKFGEEFTVERKSYE